MSDLPPNGPPSYGSARAMVELVHRLHTSPLGIGRKEIIRTLAISKRTWQRYVNVLNDSLLDENGDPLLEMYVYQDETRVRFKTKPVAVKGQAYQLMSLFMAMELLHYLSGTVFHLGAKEVLDRFFAEVQRRHTHQTSLLMKDFGKKFVHVADAPKDYSKQGKNLEEIVEALILQRWVEIEYQSPGKQPKKHRLAPLSLLMFRRGLYLIARKDLEGNELTFAIERILNVSSKQDGFAYPSQYDPKARFAHQFGLMGGTPVEILLRFPLRLKPTISDRKWHPSQQVVIKDDSLEMYLNLAPTEELKSWILSFGSLVRVISPPELVDDIRQSLSSALVQYD